MHFSILNRSTLSVFRLLISFCTFSIIKVSNFLVIGLFLVLNLPSQLFRSDVDLGAWKTCHKINFWCWFDLCYRFCDISSLFAKFRSSKLAAFRTFFTFCKLEFFRSQIHAGACQLWPKTAFRRWIDLWYQFFDCGSRFVDFRSAKSKKCSKVQKMVNFGDRKSAKRDEMWQNG